MEPFNRNRARQRIVSHEADESRRRRRSGRGPRSPRLTATGATWQNPKWALKLTTKALADAGFPIKDMRTLCGPNSPFDLVKVFGQAEIGESGDEKGEAKKDMNGGNMRKGKGREKAVDENRVSEKRNGGEKAQDVDEANAEDKAKVNSAKAKDKDKDKGKEKADDENGDAEKRNGGEKAEDDDEANGEDKAKTKADSADSVKDKGKAKEVHHVRYVANSLAALAESYVAAHRERILRDWQLKTPEERRQTVQEYRKRLGGQKDQGSP